MNHYLISGRSESGRRIADIVAADSADTATKGLEASGFDEIQVHTTDLEAMTLEKPSGRQLFRPKDLIALQTMGRIRCMAFRTVRFYRMTWPILLILPAFIALSEVTGVPWLLPGVVAVAVPLVMQSVVEYSLWRIWRLLDAYGWGRWDAVLRLLPRVRHLSTIQRVRAKAQAFAGLGRRDDAIEVHAQLEGETGYPRVGFWYDLALILLRANDLEGSLEAMERAHELAPDITDVRVGLATLVVTVRHDVQRAKQILRPLRSQFLAEPTRRDLLLSDGVIAFEERRFLVAIEKFTQAIHQCEPFLRANPAIRYNIAAVRGRLALAHAANADHDSALREFNQAKPILIANRDVRILPRCMAAIQGVTRNETD